MRLLGLFRDSGGVVASISFGFRPDFETTYRVSVSEKGTFPDGYENWIWDLFYARALHTIKTRFPSRGLHSRLSRAVLALTQHMIPKETYFTRMLPFHILSMRKF